MQLTKEQETEIYREAATLIGQGKAEPEIRTILRAKGLDDAYIGTVLVNIYKAINNRAEAVQNAATGTSSGGGSKNMLFGALWFFGGLIATMATSGQVLFYGAIIAGAIQFIAGVVQASSSSD